MISVDYQTKLILKLRKKLSSIAYLMTVKITQTALESVSQCVNKL